MFLLKIFNTYCVIKKKAFLFILLWYYISSSSEYIIKLGELLKGHKRQNKGIRKDLFSWFKNFLYKGIIND